MHERGTIAKDGEGGGMRKKKFKVFFANGDVLVDAFSENEAKILAQAQAIKNGWDYTVFKIKEIQK